MAYTGIEGNLPKWPGASKVYSKAYRWMEKHGSSARLIDALNEGNEEEIKAFFFSYTFEQSLRKDARWNQHMGY